MTHKKLFILSFLLTSILTLDASENIVDHLTFKVISSLNTLPSVEVQQVYKDRDGLMWMATRSGLCSYDGYQLKTYRTSIYSPNVFVSNNIKCLIVITVIISGLVPTMVCILITNARVGWCG